MSQGRNGKRAGKSTTKRAKVDMPVEVAFNPAATAAALADALKGARRGQHWACTRSKIRPVWENDWVLLDHPSLGKIFIEHGLDGYSLEFMRDLPDGRREVGSAKLPPELAELAMAIFDASRPPDRPRTGEWHTGEDRRHDKPAARAAS